MDGFGNDLMDKIVYLDIDYLRVSYQIDKNNYKKKYKNKINDHYKMNLNNKECYYYKKIKN